MLIRSVRLACALVVLAPITAARAASLWTPVPSGTGAPIAAIAAPKSSEVVFVTKNGEIHRRIGAGSFVSSTVSPSPPPLGFTDIAMSPDGTNGLAVGPSGAIYHSGDSGATWSAVAAPSVLTGACGDAGPGVGTPAPLSDNLTSVKYADANTAYITGESDDVLKSTNASSTTPSFTEVNKTLSGGVGGTINCVGDPGGAHQAFTDSVWTSATNGYLISNDFGLLFQTTNGWVSANSKKNIVPNGFTYRDQIAIDPLNPARIWGISGGGQNASYFQVTTDGGTTWNSPKFDETQVGLQDIAASQGAVVTVGSGGDIYTSADGRTFYRQIASPPNNATDWNAVAIVPGTNTAWVGGGGGALLTTSAANAIPGQTTLQPGVGTSGGTTTTTGGTTIVIWKKITVAGHKGRYIPVKLSTKKPRRFVVALQTTSKRHKTLAKLTATLSKGSKTVRLGVPRTVKAGSYRLVVQVFTTGKHGHHVGRSVKQVFVLV